MYIKQSELLWGLDNHFIKEFIDSAMKKTYPEGYKLFDAGDPAEYFYILRRGSIRLSVGKEDKTTYIVEHGGEAFGWSGLVGMPKYSASAECVKESTVLIFAKGLCPKRRRCRSGKRHEILQKAGTDAWQEAYLQLRR